MAAINLFLTATTSGGWRTIDEATQAAATNNDGWVVSTGSTNHSEYFVNVERAATTFTGTTVPDGTLDTTNFDAFRSTNAYTGNFANANWVMHFLVCSVTSTTGQDGRIRFRLFKADANGSNATEITSAQQQASLLTDVPASPGADSTLTFNPGAFSINNQYLFIQIAWERTGAASMSTADINWRTGSAAGTGTRFTTAVLSPSLTVDSGSYSLTGTAAKLSVKLSATSGSYSLTGTAATVKPARSIVAGTAVYTVSGQNVTLRNNHVNAESGSYTIVGSGSLLAYTFTLLSGSYSLTGADATLTKSAGGTILSVDTGTYNLTGNPAGLYSTVTPGLYTLTGQPVTFQTTRKILPNSGTYQMTGTDSNLIYTPVGGPVTSHLLALMGLGG